MQILYRLELIALRSRLAMTPQIPVIQDGHLLLILARVSKKTALYSFIIRREKLVLNLFIQITVQELIIRMENLILLILAIILLQKSLLLMIWAPIQKISQ